MQSSAAIIALAVLVVSSVLQLLYRHAIGAYVAWTLNVVLLVFDVVVTVRMAMELDNAQTKTALILSAITFLLLVLVMQPLVVGGARM